MGPVRMYSTGSSQGMSVTQGLKHAGSSRACHTLPAQGNSDVQLKQRTLMCVLQAAFGRRALGISSFFVYVALGLGLLGSSLALPFGLYVFICQRSPETCVQVCAFCHDRSVAS